MIINSHGGGGVIIALQCLIIQVCIWTTILIRWHHLPSPPESVTLFGCRKDGLCSMEAPRASPLVEAEPTSPVSHCIVLSDFRGPCSELVVIHFILPWIQYMAPTPLPSKILDPPTEKPVEKNVLCIVLHNLSVGRHCYPNRPCIVLLGYLWVPSSGLPSLLWLNREKCCGFFWLFGCALEWVSEYLS